MNIAEYAIRKKVVTLVLTVLMIVGGLYAYERIGRLEDPEFTLKDAVVITQYPGASAYEVEDEVTEVVEKAVQQLGQLDEVSSRSEPGLSIVTVTIKNTYDKNSLPQVWDELRRKVNDAQRQLPPGAGPSVVNDDFGDVYGLYFALTGDGHTMAELYDAAKMLQRELLLVKDVAKVALFGEQQEVVYAEISKEKAAQLGVTQPQIFQALANKNLVEDAGHIRAGTERLSVRPTGGFTTVEDMGDTLIAGADGRLTYLKDVATLRRGYADPPGPMLQYDNANAIGIGVSMAQGGNVVVLGDAVVKRLAELEGEIPLGMNLSVINLQSRDVTTAVSGFIANLIAAVVIVFLVLLLAMGMRSGLIIGAVLFITICGTILVIYIWGVALERISLGALIIALGMLVDNAIVVTDGIKVRIEAGLDRLQAAKDVVGQTMYPLLGATGVAVLAFAPIGLSPDSTGEFCRSLFQVLFSSLLLSWVTAITITPLLCVMFLKGGQNSEGEQKDPYGGRILLAYRRALDWCLRHRAFTMGTLLVMLVASVYGFGFVKVSFFPSSTRPQFIVELNLPRGTDIEETRQVASDVTEYLLAQDEFTHVTSMIGSGGLRFMLTYGPEKNDTSVAILLVDVDDYRVIDKVKEGLTAELNDRFPQAIASVLKYELGPGSKGKIRARFIGSDPEVLRTLANQAAEVFRSEENATNVRIDWREREKTVVPVIAEAQAQRAGITRPAIAEALRQAYAGVPAGTFRDGDQLLPIVARAPEQERKNPISSLMDTSVYSPTAQATVPMRQLVSAFETAWEDTLIVRLNRMRTIEVWCDPAEGVASELLARVRPSVEVIPLPDGYRFEWGGEYEDSGEAQGSIAANLPVPFVLMVLIVIILFNSLKQPAVIWLCVPMALIGVTVGLLVTGQPFGFMALLGLLSLSGMLIKNAVVLIDQIDLEIREGKEPYRAILDSSVSRVNPVTMAAVTTVMGMIPLFVDAFFASMAVTIAFGLSFATALTLIAVPVLYSIFFGIRPEEMPATKIEKATPAGDAPETVSVVT